MSFLGKLIVTDIVLLVSFLGMMTLCALVEERGKPSNGGITALIGGLSVMGFLGTLVAFPVLVLVMLWS